MRKFTLLIASLFITMGAMAQFETGKEYRIKVVDGDAAGEYVTIGDNFGHTFGYVHTMALDVNNADQKFTFVSSNGNWKVKSVNEEYFAHTGGTGTGWNTWNLNKTTNESSATEVIFVSTGTENEYYLRANTSQYFKVGAVDGGASSYMHVYYNAAENARTKFAVEEINTSPKAQLREALDNANTLLGSIGIGVGKYSGTYSQLEAESYLASVEEFYNSIDDTTPAATIAEYTTQINEVIGSYTLNMPENGEYFRVAYDYGGTTGKLYLQGIDSEQVKNNQVSPPAKFSSETGAESIWYYYDGVLYSYTAGKCLREEGNNRGLQSIGTKTTATFSASTRVEGKYNIACASYIHANSTGENYYTDHCTGNNCAAHDLILEAVTELPVTVTSAGYATLFAPVALTVPTEVKAYTVTINGEWATLNEITSGVIPAETGVIIAGANGEAATAGTYNFAITTSEETLESDLRGSAPATYYTEAGTYYALAQVDDVVGFYKDAFNNSRFQNNSHKAYLYVAGSANAASYSFRFGEGTTGVEKVEMRNEKSEIYDLTGRKVEAISAPGIYIVGGKKVLVK